MLKKVEDVMTTFPPNGTSALFENEQLIKRVAWMYYENDLNQQEIAEKLKLSRSKVLRLLKSSREMGFVKISLDVEFSLLLELENRLRQLAGIDECLVVPTGEDAICSVAKAMAYRFNQALRSSLAIGVGGGRTIYAFAKELDPPDKIITKEIVAVIGNTKPNLAIEPFDIASSLATKLPVEFFHVWGPSVVASEHEAEMLRQMPSIRTVLQKAEKVDIAFVGVGDVLASSFIRYGYLDKREQENIRQAGVVGEILGRFYTVEGVPHAKDINELYISIKLPASAKLIGVAGGPDKVEPIVGALRTGWLGGLITDETTAKAVLRRLTKGEKQTHS